VGEPENIAKRIWPLNEWVERMCKRRQGEEKAGKHPTGMVEGALELVEVLIVTCAGKVE